MNDHISSVGLQNSLPFLCFWWRNGLCQDSLAPRRRTCIFPWEVLVAIIQFPVMISRHGVYTQNTLQMMQCLFYEADSTYLQLHDLVSETSSFFFSMAAGLNCNRNCSMMIIFVYLMTILKIQVFPLEQDDLPLVNFCYQQGQSVIFFFIIPPKSRSAEVFCYVIKDMCFGTLHLQFA